MKIIAHRGDSGNYTENSISAFAGAIKAGAKLIECDIQEVDGEFFVFHDHTLDRLCDLSGRFTDLSASEISKLLLPNNEQIPTLRELFECVGENAVLNLEIKHLVDFTKFVSQLNQLRAEFNHKVVISSFSHPIVMKLRSLLRDARDAHEIKYAALIAHLPADLAQYAHKLDVDIAAIEANIVSRAFVDHAHSLAIEVWCYTVNDDRLYDQLNAFGVDAIFTDKPAWALEKQVSAQESE